MDAATISALLLGSAGLIGAIATYRSGASKSDLDRVTTLLKAQDDRIKEQQDRLKEERERLTEAYKQIDQQGKDLRAANQKIDEQQDQIHQANRTIDDLKAQGQTADRRILNLQRERDAFHKALNDAGIPVPEVVHDQDSSAR